MSYKVIERYLDKGHPNRPGGTLSPLKVIVFHYTGNDNAKANAEMNARYFNRAWYSSSGGKFYEADKKANSAMDRPMSLRIKRPS